MSFLWLLPPPNPAEVVWTLTSGLALQGVTKGGRVPAPTDAWLAAASSGHPAVFTEGAQLTGPDGNRHAVVKWQSDDPKWKKQGLESGSYLQATFLNAKNETLLLSAKGDSAVYVNGIYRPGDPYGNGGLTLPVTVRKGANTLTFIVGNGGVEARLDRPVAAQQFNLNDLTTPDLLTTDAGTLQAAVPVLNSLDRPAHGLMIRAECGGERRETDLPEIAPETFRKVPFEIPVPDQLVADTKATVKITLLLKGKVLNVGSIDLRVLAPSHQHKRTFISAIDGSLQYYAVTPALQPSLDNALVLTLHGAGVEAINQAQAYRSKPWCTIVAPTNRRPYGFDWEDWGRLDALEVLNLAKNLYPHDPRRVSLTGHSMGGHGTWSIGSLYPNLFASVSPSAGWISFASYVGVKLPPATNSIQAAFEAATLPSDTLARERNLLNQKVYILHGDADDNVPVTEARTMFAELKKIGANVEYHEEKGAGHWWGDQCVDWPGIFDTIKGASLLSPSDLAPIHFTTPSPVVSSQFRWATLRQTIQPGMSSVDLEINAGILSGSTKNVSELELALPRGAVHGIRLDRQSVVISADSLDSGKVFLRNRNGQWEGGPRWVGWEKNPARYGPFRDAMKNRMIFVYGTAGTRADQEAAFNLARTMAESWGYRGNGAVDLISDKTYAEQNSPGRNVILFGNEDTNRAWRRVLKACPIHVTKGRISSPRGDYSGGHLAALFMFPKVGDPGAEVGAFAFTGPAGARALSRIPVFLSGVAYPDYSILDAKKLGQGMSVFLDAGFYTNNWQLTP